MNPTEPIFDPEDPRLTAYALGELPDPAERAAVEQMLHASPEARTALREIRALTAALGAEYEQERAHAAAPPRNVVTLAPARHAWTRRLLLAAALLVCMASVARMWVAGHHAPTNTDRTRMIADLPVISPKSAVAALPSAAPALDNSLKVEPLPVPPAALAKETTPTSLSGQIAAAHVDQPMLDLDTAATPPLVASAAPAHDLAQPAAAASAAMPAPVDDLKSKDADAMMTLPATASVAMTGSAAKAVPSLAFEKQPAGSMAYVHSLNGISLDANRTVKELEATTPLADASKATGTIKGFPAPAKPVDTRMLTRREIPPSGDYDASSTLSASVSDTFIPAPGVWPQPHDNRAGTAVYEHRAENPFLAAKDNPLSTFSIDVDTASYANVRRFIESGRLPPPDAVRIEELINYFPTTDAPPAPGDEHPFAVHLEAASCPWNPQDRLVRIGIKGRELARDKRPPSNLVFLLDVSGSMEPPERLPLIQASMRLLVEQLREDDRVAIVTYAGESGIALPSTTGNHKERILAVLNALHAGGSTNGASGISLAYKVAREGFIPGGTNRVILATDGDFNVGVTNQNDLVRMIQSEAKSGVALSALGVGTDNYKDAMMQKLADKGNGNYAYIDKLDEARKVLVAQMSGTLVTIAKDVKIQVEFNPATVAAYRLIGYEKRMLRKEDFNDDRVDAGEIGAGHSVTALYEVVPAGGTVPQATPAVDALKYGEHTPPPVVSAAAPVVAVEKAGSHELLTVKMRHKAPDGDRSERSYEQSLIDPGAAGDFANASADFKFAAAVASFGLALRDSPNKGGANLGAAIELAQEGVGADAGGYRAGFIELARRAQAIQQQQRGE